MANMNIGQVVVCLAILLGLPCVSFAQAGNRPCDKFPSYETPSYVIHTDLDKDRLREAEARLLPLAEDYFRRIQPFADGKKIARTLPVYLFSKEDEYHASGGPAQGKASFNGREVMAWLPDGEKADLGWTNVQRECFRQFAHTFVSENLSAWLAEGLAVYYSEAIWTGDGYVAGVIPLVRYSDIHKRIKDDELAPLMKFVAMPQSQWDKSQAQEMEHIRNQGWSMVHFLMHADNGKHRAKLNDFVRDIVAGKATADSFANYFGHDGGPLGRRYGEWWLAQPANSTPEPYAQANVATLTSFLARANLSGMKFKDFQEFLQQAQKDKLLNETSQWLPKELLTKAVGEAKRRSGWSLETAVGKLPKLILKTSDGLVFTGSFQTVGKRVTKVEVNMVKVKAQVAGSNNKGGPSKGVPAASTDPLQHAKDRINGYHATPAD
jgi:hypothetical protein